MRFVTKPALSYDDVLLLPQHWDGGSRSEVDIKAELFPGIYMPNPIISANMDTVTNNKVAKAMFRNGGCGILHRYATHLEIEGSLRNLLVEYISIRIPSIGTTDPKDIDMVFLWNSFGLVTGLNIDIAHGDSKSMIDTIKTLKSGGFTQPIIAGNVATADACKRLLDAGASTIKCGIGNGKACETQAATGHGNKQFSTILACANAVHERGGTLIADGSIRSSGDIVKALAAGADSVMVGSLFAGSKEIGLDYYRGMAGEDAQKAFKGTAKNIEGKTINNVAQNKSIAEIMKGLIEGIQSGFSYSGAHNINELRENAEFVILK